MKKLIALIVFLAAVVGVRSADLIPAANLIDWTPGVATGVPGGIPTTRTMYVNAKTGALGAGGTYGGTLAAGDGSTDDTAAITAMIAACPANKYVYLPASTYRCDGTIFIGVSGSDDNVTLKGDGETTIIDSRTNVAIQVGPGNGFGFAGSSVADRTVSAGLTKGSTSLTIGSTSTLTAGQMVMINQDIDSSVPEVSVFAYRFLTKQVVKVVAVTNGTTFTISPALYDGYGSGSVTVVVYSLNEHATGVGIEDLLIEKENAADGSNGVNFSQTYASWIKGVRVRHCKNYPFSIVDSLQSEIRRSFADARAGGGTNGAGILLSVSSGVLIEDNIVVDNFPDMEVNSGASGNLISRNYTYGTNFLDSNHNPQNRFNLYEGNSVNGFKSDGYFGGEQYGIYFNNKARFASLYRFTRNHSIIGNVFGQTAAANAYGYPNFGNDSYSGTADYPSDPWRDLNMTGEIVDVTKGTGTGYLVNNSGGYSVGATAITLDTGTGTILAGDCVMFSSPYYRYKVVSFSGGVLTIGRASGVDTVGLLAAIGDNEPVTISSDNGVVRFDSGLLAAYNTFEYHAPVIHWDSYASRQIFKVSTVTGDEATLIPFSDTQPNVTPLPAIGTAVVIGSGAMNLVSFQELDLGVASTLILKGNRYSDGAFDSLDGATLPSSLAYGETKPQWITDAETEFSTTFNLRPFDPVGAAPASDSDIPAGYRYFFATAPEHTTASLLSPWNLLAIGSNKPLVVGVGGSPTVSLSGGITGTYSHMSGSTIVFTLSRTITEGEVLTVSLTNVANGYEDVSGNDLPSFSDLSVSNPSDSVTGVVHYGPTMETMGGTSGSTNDSAVTAGNPILVTANGIATAVRFYVVTCAGDVPTRVTICDEDGYILATGTGTTSGNDRYQSIAVTSLPLVSGTTYIATMQFASGAGNPVLASRSGVPSGSSIATGELAYASAFPAQFTALAPQTYEWAIQIRATVDEVPSSLSSATITTTTLNAGSIIRAP